MLASGLLQGLFKASITHHHRSHLLDSLFLVPAVWLMNFLHWANSGYCL